MWCSRDKIRHLPGPGGRSTFLAVVILILKTPRASKPRDNPPPPADIAPKRLAMVQNHRNPFNPKTTIHYDVPFDSEVTLAIYDAGGIKVETLVSGFITAGSYPVEWDAAGHASGVYFARITAGTQVETIKIVLVK